MTTTATNRTARPRNLTVNALIAELTRLRSAGYGTTVVTVAEGRPVRSVELAAVGGPVQFVQAPDLYVRQLDSAVMRGRKLIGWIYPEGDQQVAMAITGDRLGEAATTEAALTLFDR